MDLVVVDKSSRQMHLIRGSAVIRTYRVALGPNPRGHKSQQGDGRTPEGSYTLDYINENSAYHRSMHVSYPNAEDTRQAKARGVDPGGLIMIHGQPNGDPLPRWGDWTLGCIAITNAEMDEFLSLVGVGTPIHLEW